MRWTRRRPRAPWFCLCTTVDHMKQPIRRIGSAGSVVAGLFCFNNTGSIRAAIAIEA